MATARIATWNLERKKPDTPTGRAGVEHLRSLDANVMVLTEGRRSFPAGDGHLIWSQSWGSDDERKVVMWSRNPWRQVDEVGHGDSSPGRYDAARTDTPIGEICVIGVCIPWHMLNVQYGNRNRKPWEEHIAFCGVFKRMIANYPDRAYVIAGDFNQRIADPPARGSARHDAMADLLDGLDTPTIGVPPGWEREENDHIVTCLLYTSPSPRDRQKSRMPSSA